MPHRPANAIKLDLEPGSARLTDGRRLSCGVVIVNPERELLLCHVTRQHHWDLPKGGMDVGETPLATALRETFEETGLQLEAERLIDLGRHRYTQKKDLHLYATCLPRIDTASLRCESHYLDRASNGPLPEMDGYGWFAFDAVRLHCTAKMAAVLGEGIDLEAVWRRLAGTATGVASAPSFGGAEFPFTAAAPPP